MATDNVTPIRPSSARRTSGRPRAAGANEIKRRAERHRETIFDAQAMLDSLREGFSGDADHNTWRLLGIVDAMLNQVAGDLEGITDAEETDSAPVLSWRDVRS